MLEQNLSRLLSGQAIEENEDLCDFTLADQNEAFGKQHRFSLTSFST